MKRYLFVSDDTLSKCTLPICGINANERVMKWSIIEAKARRHIVGMLNASRKVERLTFLLYSQIVINQSMQISCKKFMIMVNMVWTLADVRGESRHTTMYNGMSVSLTHLIVAPWEKIFLFFFLNGGPFLYVGDLCSLYEGLVFPYGSLRGLPLLTKKFAGVHE